MSRYVEMRIELLAEFEAGKKSVEAVVKRLNKKRTTESKQLISMKTAKGWWKRFQSGDTSLKRRFVDNCELKIGGAKCSHACRLEHESNWKSMAFDGRFLFEFHEDTLCAIDTYHGRKRDLVYEPSIDDPRFHFFRVKFPDHKCKSCTDYEKVPTTSFISSRAARLQAHVTKRKIKEENSSEHGESSKDATELPPISCTNLALHFHTKAGYLKIRDLKLLDDTHCLIIDSSSYALALIEVDFSRGVFYVRAFSRFPTNIMTCMRLSQDVRNTSKFVLPKLKTFDNSFGWAELNDNMDKLSITKDEHTLPIEDIEFQGETHRPQLSFTRLEGHKITGLGLIDLHRNKKIDLLKLYEYDYRTKIVETSDLVMNDIRREMNTLNNKEPPHAWIDERLYVVSRHHTQYNKTSILVLDTQRYEWTDLKVNVNGSITALISPTFQDNGQILLVKMQKLVPELQKYTRYVRLPTGRPDNLVVLVWARLCNYCEDKSDEVRAEIKKLLPPTLQCPFEEAKIEEIENEDSEEK